MEVKKFTRNEIANRNNANDAVIIIDNVVYDVTEFLEDHPGGREVLLQNAGQDASRCFHQVGHSEVALEWRQKFRIGEVDDADKWEVLTREAFVDQEEPLTIATLLNVWGPPLLLAILASLFYIYVI